MNQVQKTEEEPMVGKKRLGPNGPEVSSLGLGCMGMSEFYGTADERESMETIHMALDRGVNLLDTADVYGPFTNEELVGKAIRGKRRELFLSTKFGIVRSLHDPHARGVNGRPEYVRECCDASLRRLGVDEIDLYYQHRVDPDVPIEETVGAMAGLVEKGKVRYIGLSEAKGSTISRAHAVHPITALQSEYSLFTREPEDEILGLCSRLGIGFVAYSPLGRGFLTGRIRTLDELSPDDSRRSSPRFQGDNFRKNLALVDRINEMARGKRCTPAQLALAWVAGRGEHVVPLFGTKRREYLDENLGAFEVVLTEDDLKEIDRISPKGAAAGDRFIGQGMKLVNR